MDTHSIEVDLEASISRSSSIRMGSVEISGLLSQVPPGVLEPPIQEFFFDLLQTQPLARRWKQQGFFFLNILYNPPIMYKHSNYFTFTDSLVWIMGQQAHLSLVKYHACQRL